MKLIIKVMILTYEVNKDDYITKFTFQFVMELHMTLANI